MDGLPEYRSSFFRAAVVFLVFVAFFSCSGCSDTSPDTVPDYSQLAPEALLSHSATGTPAERLEACRCLATHKQSEMALKELITLTSDGDKMVQIAAIAGLGQSGKDSVVPTLLTFLQSKDMLLPYQAMNALMAIGNKAALKGILTSCEKDSGLASEFNELMSDEKNATGLADGLIALAVDSRSASSLRLSALQFLKNADCGKEQIKILFKAGKAEKNRKVARELVKSGKELKHAFLQRKQVALQHSSEIQGKNPPPKNQDALEAEKRAQVINTQAVKVREAEKRTQAIKAREAQRRAQAIKAQAIKVREGQRRAKALKARKARKRAQAMKAREAEKRAQAVNAKFGWIEPSDALADFVSEAVRHMRDGGDRSRAVRAYNQGVEASSSGDISGAVSAYLRAVEELSSFKEAHYALAMLYDRQRNYTRGLFHLSQCLLLEPEKSDVYYRAGCNFENQNKVELAHAFFRLASEKDPSNGEYPFRAGLIAFRKQDLQGAVTLLKQAAALSPRRGDIFQNLSALHLNLGNYDVARQYALKARSLGADVSAVLAAIESSSR